MKYRATTVIRMCLLAGVSLLAQRAVAQEQSTTPRLVSVSGSAVIRVAPDVVIVTFGVDSRAAELDDAVAAHSKRISQLIGYIKSAGIPGKHIQTDYISIRPVYDRRVSQIEPSYYEVQKSVTVRVEDIERFEPLLAGALKSGATHVHGIQFRTSQLRKHRDAARANAVKAAKEKAKALTSELGASIGRVYAITETTWGGGSYTLRGGLPMQNSMQNVSGADAGGEFAAGQISISARVQVSFEIE